MWKCGTQIWISTGNAALQFYLARPGQLYVLLLQLTFEGLPSPAQFWPFPVSEPSRSALVQLAQFQVTSWWPPVQKDPSCSLFLFSIAQGMQCSSRLLKASIWKIISLSPLALGWIQFRWGFLTFIRAIWYDCWLDWYFLAEQYFLWWVVEYQHPIYFRSIWQQSAIFQSSIFQPIDTWLSQQPHSFHFPYFSCQLQEIRFHSVCFVVLIIEGWSWLWKYWAKSIGFVWRPPRSGFWIGLNWFRSEGFGWWFGGLINSGMKCCLSLPSPATRLFLSSGLPTQFLMYQLATHF